MIAQITLSGCPKYPAGERGLKDRSRGCKTPDAPACQLVLRIVRGAT